MLFFALNALRGSLLPLALALAGIGGFSCSHSLYEKGRLAERLHWRAEIEKDNARIHAALKKTNAGLQARAAQREAALKEAEARARQAQAALAAGAAPGELKPCPSDCALAR